MRRGRDRLAHSAAQQVRAASVPPRATSPCKSPKKGATGTASLASTSRSPRKPISPRKQLLESPKKAAALQLKSPTSPPLPEPPCLNRDDGKNPKNSSTNSSSGSSSATTDSGGGSPAAAPEKGGAGGTTRGRAKTTSPARRRSSLFKHPHDQEIREVQAAIASYTYNMNGPTYDVSKDRPLSELCLTAEEILGCPEQPIQCVEAAFLGIHLTQGMDVIRFPMSFHSKAWKDGFGPFPDKPGSMSGSPVKPLLKKRRKGEDDSDDDDEESCSPKLKEGEKEYDIVNHLVIGLYKRGFFGAVGISRNPGLHSKPMTFTCFSDMIWDYSQHYRKDRHVLLSVRLGDAIEHTPTPDAYTPLWRRVEIKLSRWHIAEQRLYQFQEQLIASSKKAGCYARPPIGTSPERSLPVMRPQPVPVSPV